MKIVCFLLPDAKLKPTSLFAAIDVFEKANEYLTRKDGRPFYDIRLVGNDVRQALVNNRLTITTQSIHDIPNPDLIVIPAIEAIDEHAIKRNEKLIAWVVDRHKKGTEI